MDQTGHQTPLTYLAQLLLNIKNTIYEIFAVQFSQLISNAQSNQIKSNQSLWLYKSITICDI